MSELDADVAIVERALTQLGEHFDAVQIFASRNSNDGEGGTDVISKGSGNWFARVGMVHDWMIKQDESTRIEERQRRGGDGE